MSARWSLLAWGWFALGFLWAIKGEVTNFLVCIALAQLSTMKRERP